MTSNLEKYNTSLLRQVVNTLVSAVKLEMIFLYAASYRQHCTEHIFTGASLVHRSIPSYDLLLLTSDASKPPLDQLQAHVDNISVSLTPVTVYLQTVEVFNKWLSEGHYFSIKVYDQGFRCFNAGDNLLTKPKLIDAVAARMN